MGRAGAVGGCGLEGRQGPLGAGQSMDWWFWHFVCMLLFFSNQEAGFGIYVLSHSLGSGGRQGWAGKGHGGQIPPSLQPRTLEPSVAREPDVFRTHVDSGESSLEIKKK